MLSRGEADVKQTRLSTVVNPRNTKGAVVLGETVPLGMEHVRSFVQSKRVSGTASRGSNILARRSDACSGSPS